MKKFQKWLAVLLSLVTISAGVVNLAGCNMSVGQVASDLENVSKSLPAPTVLRIEQGALCWNPVDYATKYTVSIDGKEYYVADYSYPLIGVSDGDHIFKVKANGDDILYKNSGWSDPYTATIKEGAVSRDYAYKDFVNLSENESYLGYGFDVINSAVFSDKYVKTSFPIFNYEGLMNQRLVKVESKQTRVEEIKSSSMEEFIQSWNANAHVNVSWGQKKIGGSVDVDVKYSGGVANAKSKYFHSISFYNQEFYIVMQSDLNTYKTILNEGFMSDLYSDMEPAVFFDRYGTHFITSAVMGGRIDSHYLYTSEQEQSYHDISGKVSVSVRNWSNSTNVDVSGGYRQEATSQNIDIKNTLEVIGGGDFGIISDSDIAGNYLEWEKSLDEHAALMGIKDTGSLIPLWELIDSTKDTKTYTFTNAEGETVTGSRAQQLQAYFLKYGVEAYNELMVNAGLPEIVVPEEIDNVRVNNQLPTNNEYEVFAGAKNDISFTVLPENATSYTKTASLTTESEYVTINNENGLTLDIAANCPHNTVLQVVLSAGSVRKTINVRVVRRYSVTFKSNGGTVIDPIQNIEHGEQIDKPKDPEKEGFIFKGWYTDPNFAEETKYRFGAQAIVDNMTVYAKWEEYFPTITFVHNVEGCELLIANVTYNTTYAEPIELVNEGHTLVGYYVNKDMTIAYDFATPLKEDITIYVKWTPLLFTMTFDSVGGTEVAPKENVAWGTKVIKPLTPTKKGYIFSGWYQDAEYGNLFDFEQNVIKTNVTLYAKWLQDPITIFFVPNNGESVEDRIILKGDTLGENLPDLAREYYSFEGWYTDEEYTEQVYGTTGFMKETTLYAKWEKNTYTISYQANNGIIGGAYTVEYQLDDTVIFPTITRDYYTFNGWYLEEDCITSVDAIALSSAPQTVTLYANWLVNVYKVGSLLTYTVEDKVIVLPTLTKAYYTFGGWFEDAAYTKAIDMDALLKEPRDIEIAYKKWTKNTYKITYNRNGGTFAATSFTTQYQVGDTITLPNISSDDSVFVGWFTNKSFTKKVNTADLSKAPCDIELYAKLVQVVFKNHYVLEDKIYVGQPPFGSAEDYTDRKGFWFELSEVADISELTAMGYTKCSIEVVYTFRSLDGDPVKVRVKLAIGAGLDSYTLLAEDQRSNFTDQYNFSSAILTATCNISQLKGQKLLMWFEALPEGFLDLSDTYHAIAIDCTITCLK